MILGANLRSNIAPLAELLLFVTLGANSTRPTPPAGTHKGGKLDPEDVSAALRRNIGSVRSQSDGTA